MSASDPDATLSAIDDAVHEWEEWDGVSDDAAEWSADGSHEYETGGWYYGDDDYHPVRVIVRVVSPEMIAALLRTAARAVREIATQARKALAAYGAWIRRASRRQARAERRRESRKRTRIAATARRVWREERDQVRAERAGARKAMSVARRKQLARRRRR